MATPATADSELKSRHRAMWASGDYPSMVETFLLPLGPRLADAAGIRSGDRVLDVAAGTGNASLPAAARARPASKSSGVRSLAVTSAPRCAAGIAALPVPAATSRTRWPGSIPLASTRRGPRGRRNVSTIVG